MTSNKLEQPTIQTAKEEDIDEIQNLYNHKQVKKELHWFTYREGLERAVQNEGRDILFIQDNESRIIGASMVWCESRVLEPGEAQIRLIAVHPEYRNLGLGADLVKASEKYAKKSGKTILVAETASSSNANEFWIAMNFEIKSKRTTNGGREMSLVEKHI